MQVSSRALRLSECFISHSYLYQYQGFNLLFCLCYRDVYSALGGGKIMYHNNNFRLKFQDSILFYNVCNAKYNWAFFHPYKKIFCYDSKEKKISFGLQKHLIGKKFVPKGAKNLSISNFQVKLILSCAIAFFHCPTVMVFPFEFEF